MNVPHALTSLYPPPVRERWGDELACEVTESGPRSWPDTALGALRLWLHPRDWPELIAGHTCAVLTCALAAVTAAAGLLVRAAEPSTYLTADPARPATSVWALLVLAGILLAAPRPPMRAAALSRLAGRSIRELAAPAALALLMWLLANADALAHPSGITRLGFVAFYWISLAFSAFRVCRLIAYVVSISSPPSRRRMYAALLLLGAGLALAAGQSQIGVAHDPATLAIGAGLGVLAAGVLVASANLHTR